MKRNTTITVLNAVAGVWFILAAFLWRRAGGERLDALLVAAAALAVGFGAWRVRALRWLDVPLGLWMLAAIWLVPHRDPFTAWNLACFGGALLVAPFAARWLEDGRPAGATA